MPKDHNISNLLFLTILLIFILYQPSTAQSNKLTFKHYGPKEGLESNTVYSIYKDSRGFMWLCTQGGLYRFDGQKMKCYRNDPTDSTSISGNALVTDMYEDKKGNLWLGTGAGLCIYNRILDNFKRYNHDPNDKFSIPNNNPQTFLCAKNGDIWIGYDQGGISRYNPSDDNFTSYIINETVPISPENTVIKLAEDPIGNIMVGTIKGLYIFNIINERFELFKPLDSSFIYDIHKENDSIIWVGTWLGLYKYNFKTESIFKYDLQSKNNITEQSSMVVQIRQDHRHNGRYLWISSHGLVRFDKNTGETIRYLNDPNDPESLGYNRLWGIFLESNGMLWIGKESGGLDVTNTVGDNFYQFPILSPSTLNEVYDATTFLNDNIGNLWVGTGGKGLFEYDPSMKFIKHWSLGSPENEYNYFVFSMFQDLSDNLWVGTLGRGLYKIGRNRKSLEEIMLKSPIGYPYYITDITQDFDGTMLVGTNNGLYAKHRDSTNFRFVEIKSGSKTESLFVRSILEDKYNNLWVGTQNHGLLLVPYNEKSEMSAIIFQHQENNPHSLTNNKVMSLFEDSKGRIWVGTLQGLNMVYKNDRDEICFSHVGKKELNHIYDIVEGPDSNLWLITEEQGLVYFNPRNTDHVFIKVMRKEDGIPFEDIYRYDFYMGLDGMVYVGARRGSGKGFYRFSPSSLKTNKSIPPIVITDFLVRNEPEELDTIITEKKHIQLNYKQNFLSFEFAALDYINPNENQYAYMLTGIDESWVESGTRKFSNYTNIPPGEYTYRVKGSNNDGIWNEVGTSIQIKIKPPPWKTFWAYMAYGVFILCILYIIRSIDVKRRRLMYKLELEKIEKEKLGELDRMKSHFFANISHEFRTPLTLILGPLLNIEKEDLSSKIKKEISVIQRNAIRLQTLINQLLNLSKLESGKMKLQLQKQNIIKLVKGYTQAFESLGKQKGIQLEFHSNCEDLIVLVDKDKIEKILFNLLSNAFKFTLNGGLIKVSILNLEIDGIIQEEDDSLLYPLLLTNKDKRIVIAVTDTGVGINPQLQTRIFDRFYQADDASKSFQESSGIGLALTKELVELHKGHIEVNSEEGVGSCFCVFLIKSIESQEGEPMDKDGEYSQPEFEGINEIDGLSISSQEISTPVDINQYTFEEKRPILLIVEDNPDLRIYIKENLENAFNIIEASDGKNGFQIAIEYIPDIVLSDVMMPEMDGYELCKKLKLDERTSHIPVILLTARASTESRLEGLEAAADDFLTKPFDPNELILRIKNLILQRERLKTIYLNSIVSPVGFSDSSITSADKKFMEKILILIGKNITDPDFNVERLSDEMALSRMQLHRKLTGLVNQSASDFIRTVRLNKAAMLIRGKSANIAQIAYDVGFNNPSYFSECFKKQFGKLPSEY